MAGAVQDLVHLPLVEVEDALVLLGRGTVLLHHVQVILLSAQDGGGVDTFELQVLGSLFFFFLDSHETKEREKGSHDVHVGHVIYTSTYLYMYVCAHECKCVCVHVCACECSVCVVCVWVQCVCMCTRMCVQCVCVCVCVCVLCVCGYELTNGVDIERACLPQTGSGEEHPPESSSESSLNAMLAVLEGNSLDILGVRRKMPDDGDNQ